MYTKNNLVKVFSILAVLAILLSNIQPQPVKAQRGEGDGLERKVNAETGRINFIVPEKGVVLPAAQAFGEMSVRPQDPALALATRYGPEFGLKDAQSELAAAERQQGEEGRLTVRYQQEYQDVPVMGGELIVNTNGQGDLYSINGEVSPGLSLSTQPGITAEAARQAALDGMAQWYEKPAEVFVTTEPELWIYDESLLKTSTCPVELTWRMEVTAKENAMPVRELVLVNAQDGSVSLHFNQVDTSWSSLKSNVMPTSRLLNKDQQISKESVMYQASTAFYVATTGKMAVRAQQLEIRVQQLQALLVKQGTEQPFK
jgi:hypothetical protein